jgi:hypothetical protein
MHLCSITLPCLQCLVPTLPPWMCDLLFPFLLLTPAVWRMIAQQVLAEGLDISEPGTPPQQQKAPPTCTGSPTLGSVADQPHQLASRSCNKLSPLGLRPAAPSHEESGSALGSGGVCANTRGLGNDLPDRNDPARLEGAESKARALLAHTESLAAVAVSCYFIGDCGMLSVSITQAMGRCFTDSTTGPGNILH